MSSKSIANDNNGDGWANVSKKSREKKTSKKHNPYIEIIDLETDGQRYNTYTPFLVLLVGLPGSGKSTFAQSLVASMPYKFCRINQDQLKTRQKCERKLKQVLSLTSESSSHSRLCPIIDRCNFDVQQRSTWYRLAEEASGQEVLTTSIRNAVDTNMNSTLIQSIKAGIPVDVIVFDLPFDECLRRCKLRKGHETIKSPHQAIGVLNQLRRQWSPPNYQKDHNERSRIRSLTVIRTEKERKECLVRLLKQTD